jgi:predicted nucleic acid-binding protein
VSVERATYLDSSAIVKLVVREEESSALRAYLRRRGPYVSSALARTEVSRAMLPLGAAAGRRAHDVLDRIELIRVGSEVLSRAGVLLPVDLRSLDAIHLATTLLLGRSLRAVVTYDARMARAAGVLGLLVATPS